MNGAWWFLFGWLSASALIFFCTRGERSRAPGWLDAQDTQDFVDGCEQLLNGRGL